MQRACRFGNRPPGSPTRRLGLFPGAQMGYHGHMSTPLPPFPMTSARPFLLRTLYEWIVTNGCTPHLVVDATLPGVRVPAHAVKDGRIVLNIADRAVQNMRMTDEGLSFSARFGDRPFPIVVPMDAVLALYARENGAGMALPTDQGMGLASVQPSGETGTPISGGSAPSSEVPASPPSDSAGSGKAGRGHLRVVK